MNVVRQIVEVYRKNGRLSTKLVMKILRTTYRMLKLVTNIARVDIGTGCKMNVVGDIHGQLSDLLHILDEAGFPADDNKYIFNGDFVDRGQNSVECICILLALYAADPQNVYLNRGNHEDIAINRVYGFQAECVEKYGELAYGMFCEVFRYLPLFTIANDDIFVVHAGLFHDANVLYSDLEQIDRLDYVTRPPILYPECTEGMSKEDARKEFLKQLQRDALWSDPMEETGIEDNPRGAGVCFGPDIAQTFMDNNHLSMVIRSHECVRTGFCLHYVNDFETNICPPGVPLVCTIFSASNYCNGDNFGAYITILPHKFAGAQPVARSGLYYTVHRYKTSNGDGDLAAANQTSLSSLILRKKNALRMAFQAVDHENSQEVSRTMWADVMARVTGVKIRWLAVLKSLCKAEYLTPKAVKYMDFLDQYTTEKLVPQSERSATGAGIKMMDAMYFQKKKLESVFYYFDTNGDGRISREEFHQGCDILNSYLPPDSKQRLTDIDHTLDLMDFDGSDDLDINEFFEVFRILDAKDGKVDGILSLAAQSRAAPVLPGDATTLRSSGKQSAR
jgi:serine/threonine-protein phosphatase with EF-hand domain